MIRIHLALAVSNCVWYFLVLHSNPILDMHVITNMDQLSNTVHVTILLCVLFVCWVHNKIKSYVFVL